MCRAGETRPGRWKWSGERSVPTRTDLAQEYLDKSMANDIDAVMELVTDDVVLNRGMLGTVTGNRRWRRRCGTGRRAWRG